MANKLPWFTHDHDAHEDEFIQASMDRFGAAGYSNYFITLELLHNHGVGDVLFMRAGRYAKHLRSRLDLVKKWLTFAGSFRDHSGNNPKIISEFIQGDSGEDVRIEIKKFRERQGKLKIKTPSTLPQDSAKTPLEGEEEREGEDRVAATPPSALLELWNNEKHTTLPKAEALTKKREASARLRLSERSLEDWRAIVQRINASPFCLGQNDRGWRADFDFLLRPDTAVKVLEGKYDPKEGANAPSRTNSNLSATR